MPIKPLILPPRRANFAEGQALGLKDICRMYRVPPHLVAPTLNGVKPHPETASTKEIGK